MPKLLFNSYELNNSLELLLFVAYGALIFISMKYAQRRNHNDAVSVRRTLIDLKFVLSSAQAILKDPLPPV
jgi:hypothetical protein